MKQFIIFLWKPFQVLVSFLNLYRIYELWFRRNVSNIIPMRRNRNNFLCWSIYQYETFIKLTCHGVWTREWFSYRATCYSIYKSSRFRVQPNPTKLSRICRQINHNFIWAKLSSCEISALMNFEDIFQLRQKWMPLSRQFDRYELCSASVTPRSGIFHKFVVRKIPKIKM